MRCTAELVAKLPSHEVYVAVLDNEKEVDSEREGSTWESYDTLIDDGTDEGSRYPSAWITKLSQYQR